MGFLPINQQEMDERAWSELDFLYISGDAYVDHPSFGHAIITRILEKEGFRVGILPQPDWKNIDTFKQFGSPRLGVLVASGVIDSMVNHYTAAKKSRSEDLYSPGGKAGKRPDRAVIVYCNKIREAFDDVPIIIGGIEASLRRFAHYDYWDDAVRRSILIDSSADLLIYGMGEKPIVQIAKLLDKGVPIRKIKDVEGTCYLSNFDELPSKIKEFVANSNSKVSETNSLRKNEKEVNLNKKNKGYDSKVNDTKNKSLCNDDMCLIPSFEDVIKSKEVYAKAFKIQYYEQDHHNGRILIQPYRDKYLVQNKPSEPLDEKSMDRVYALPYERTYHPSYEKFGGIPAIREVEFSITSHRGCFGGCAFCALNFHQGRVIQKRSRQSIINEAKNMTYHPDFKGYIHDLGGPTANFRNKACKKQETEGVCKNRQCLYPTPCKNLKVDHTEYLGLLREVRTIPGIKKVFIRSGIRYDYLIQDKNEAFFNELCEHHISGQLKVAPEHISDRVLNMMGKPGRNVYERFVKKYYDINEKLGKDQYLVPYLVSSHPGSDMKAAVELAVYLKEIGYLPEQVQDFYPTPGTLATCMYYTGLDPRDMKKVYVPKDPREKAMQRALLQYRKKENYKLVIEALKLAGREDLIGFGRECLVKPLKNEAIRKKSEANKNGDLHRNDNENRKNTKLNKNTNQDRMNKKNKEDANKSKVNSRNKNASSINKPENDQLNKSKFSKNISKNRLDLKNNNKTTKRRVR